MFWRSGPSWWKQNSSHPHTIKMWGAWSELALCSQWEDVHLHGAPSPCRRETSRVDPGGPQDQHQACRPQLGQMPPHHKEEAIGRTPISFSRARTFPTFFQEHLTAILLGKWENTNLVSTAPFTSNDSIFGFSLVIQAAEGNTQHTYKPSKHTAACFLQKPSIFSSSSRWIQVPDMFAASQGWPLSTRAEYHSEMKGLARQHSKKLCRAGLMLLLII